MGGLACAHCALTLVVAFLTFVVGVAPPIFGVSAGWFLPPFFILGLFALWLWSGRGRPGRAAGR